MLKSSQLSHTLPVFLGRPLTQLFPPELNAMSTNPASKTLKAHSLASAHVGE